MVVGQNPGHDEVIQGTPFVGASGHFFDTALMDVLGIDRSLLYISNAVRCFTPGNRRPYQEEADNCRDFLDREVAILNPVVIVTLGGPAFKQVTGMSGIMKHHGQIRFSPRYRVPVLPLLHPSPYNTNSEEGRKMFYDDLEHLREFLNAGPGQV